VSDPADDAEAVPPKSLEEGGFEASETAAPAGGAAEDPTEPETLDWGPDPDVLSQSLPSPPEGPPPAAPPSVPTAVEPPSPDVALADDASPLPGAHRGGFQRLPTAPVCVTQETAPSEPGASAAEEPALQWLMPENPAPHRGLAPWALAFSLAGLIGSIFVGWGFPIGLVGVISAILALRRPLESRAMAVWALVLGALSVLYSAGWLFYAASRANLFG
jgi:hypothetical protein